MLLNRLSLKDLPPHAISLASDVLLVSLPVGTSINDPLPFKSSPPYGTVEVLGSAGIHQIAAMRLAEVDQTVQHHEDNIYDTADFPKFPIILGDDVGDLAADLDEPSRLRLLNFLLGFCRKAFELGTDPDFIHSCLKLAHTMVSHTGIVEPIAAVEDNWVLVSGITIPSDATLWAIGPNRVRRQTLLLPDDNVPLVLTERVSSADKLLVVGHQTALMDIGPVHDGSTQRSQQQSDNRNFRNACFRTLAKNCPETAAILREQAIFAASKPVKQDDLSKPVAGALEAAISDGKGKIFLRGWLHDPLGLVSSIELSGFKTTTNVDTIELHRFHRPDLEKRLAMASFPTPGNKAGFVAFLEDELAGLNVQPTLLFGLHSGARIAVRPPLQIPRPAEARTAVLTSVAPQYVTDTMLEKCLGPAAASFHEASLAGRGEPEVIRIGKPIRSPRTSIVVPLYRNLSFLKFQISAFAADPNFDRNELIYVLDSPEQRGETEHLLRGLHEMFEIPMTLLVMPRNLGYAAATNAGCGSARAPVLLLLNSDIIPDQIGWLDALHGALEDDDVGAAGPKLLFEDESIQHAGLYFSLGADEIWFNAHYDKGMPRYWSAANISREVPGLTGAAILVRTEDFVRVGGVCEEYIVGDYEDSDFCLRLRQIGKKMMYVAEAELFHFERRSITMHKGYSGTLACRYNRELHHRRWKHSISELMINHACLPINDGSCA